MKNFILLIFLFISNLSFSVDIQHKEDVGVNRYVAVCVFGHSSDTEGYLYTALTRANIPSGANYQPVLDENRKNVGCKRESNYK